MNPQVRFWMLIILASAAAVVFIIWTTQLIWHSGTEFDRNPSRSEIKNQLMRRKSEAMHDILDEMVMGNLGRVHSAAKRMERYGKTIDSLLASEVYDKLSRDFYQAVDDLTAATAHEDINNAKEAALRLEKSCIECHILLNTRRTERQ